MVKPISLKAEPPVAPNASASAVGIPPAPSAVRRAPSESIPLKPDALSESCVPPESPPKRVSASLNNASLEDVAPLPYLAFIAKIRPVGPFIG